MQDLPSMTQEALLELTSCMMTSFAKEQETTILRITVIWNKKFEKAGVREYYKYTIVW
jgi:hypothetical protein